MRAVLTRVKSASVEIGGEVVGKIGQGFLILLGVGPEDDEKTCRYLAEKALGLRVFEDEDGKVYLFYQGSPDMGNSWYLSKCQIDFKDGKPYIVNE